MFDFIFKITSKFELIEAILALINVCKEPFTKEKASDENTQVPNLPVFFDALCKFLRYEYPTPEDRDLTEEEFGLIDEFDTIK